MLALDGGGSVSKPLGSAAYYAGRSPASSTAASSYAPGGGGAGGVLTFGSLRSP
jgi:hypothetical protein